MRARIALLLTVALTACASGDPPPGTGYPERVIVRGDAGQLGAVDYDLIREDNTTTGVLDAPVAEVWKQVLPLYEEIGIDAGDLAIFEPTAYQIAVEKLRVRELAGKRLTAYLSCSSAIGGATATSGRTLVTLATWLESYEGGTAVHTRLEATSRQGGTSTSTVPCTTNGTLEREMMKRLQLRLLQARGTLPGGA